MSNRSRFGSFTVRMVPLALGALLPGAIAACGSDTSGGTGTSPLGGNVAGATMSVAGAANTAGAPAAGATNTSAGSNSVAGDSNAGAGNSGGMPSSGGSGGGTASGGASGGSGGSGGGSGGGATTGCADLKLCDDFEGDAPGKGASPWKVTGGTAVTVVTDQHNSGMHSVHIAAPDTSGFSANIQETKTFPAADFWGRAFLRFKATAGGHQMYIAVNLSGDQLRLLNRLGSDAAQVNFQKTDKFYDTGFKVPQEKWFCYEWHVTTSAVSISVDGTARTVTIPGITGGSSLSLGFQRYAAGGGAGELWIDDVAVSDKQIGCN